MKIIEQDVVVGKTTARGIEIPLTNARLILITTTKGYVMCGYLDIATAEKMGDCAAVIRGVSSIDALLEGKVAALTTAAAKAGISIGMKGREALEKLV